MSGQGRDDESLLVGIVNSRRDVTILDEERWYRIPVSTIERDPRDWPPKWFAAFERVSANGKQQQVVRYAEVLGHPIRSRDELFPGEPAADKAERMYYQLLLGEIHHLSRPLIPRKPRRNPFIRTTIGRLHAARGFNDLFSDANLGGFEDELWQALEAEKILAERQWEFTARKKRKYVLDFAIFCRNRVGIDVEVDGKRHHYIPEQSQYDAERGNDLEAKGWKVLRYRTDEIRTKLETCMNQIRETIMRQGGLETDPVGRQYVAHRGRVSAQLAMFENRERYDQH